MALLPWQIRRPLGLPMLRSDHISNDGMRVLQGSGHRRARGWPVWTYQCMQPLLHAVHIMAERCAHYKCDGLYCTMTLTI